MKLCWLRDKLFIPARNARPWVTGRPLKSPKISFSINLVVFRASGPARVKLHSKYVLERFATAIKIERIPLFDVRCLLFSFTIKLTALRQALAL
jgi:hypothetical protein